MYFVKILTLVHLFLSTPSTAFSQNAPEVNRRDAIQQTATILASGTVAAKTLVSEPEDALAAFGSTMPLMAKVQKLESANYMGRIGQPIYPANSNGAPEKHIPQVSIKGNDVEIVANHVMSDEHYIQFMWLKDVKTNEVVLAKELTPQEEKPVLRAKVPSGVELRPYLFCNLHGLWKGEPFTVTA
mmetsp:Transcript_15689/g.29595  ORF Transcript_15689/g.29595 Transcript_15689/m.29595 type:complete len:185 (-) Transcript_15689:141-695(-)